MKLPATLRLRQRDEVTCGPAVAVVACAMLDPAYRAALLAPGAGAGAETGLAWFAAEQSRVHAMVNRVWPRRLGTTPAGLARAISAHSAVRYQWRLVRGRAFRWTDVVDAVAAGWPVAMLVGAVIPRHWVLLVDVAGDKLQCYEPSTGLVTPLDVAATRAARLSAVGFPRPFVVVLPRP
jgi:hypothetical protein